MDREALQTYILEQYQAEADHPWLRHPKHTVFRHGGNKKWFALIMDVPRNKLGLSGEERMDVVNLKCDPILTGTLRTEPGFFPAYHMNKENWITASLDGSVSEDQLKILLDMSYHATAPKGPRARGEQTTK